MNFSNLLFVSTLVIASSIHGQVQERSKQDTSVIEYSQAFIAGLGKAAIAQAAASILVPTETLIDVVHALGSTANNNIMTPVNKALGIIKRSKQLQDITYKHVSMMPDPEKTGFALGTTLINLLYAIAIHELITNKRYFMVALLTPSILTATYLEAGALSGLIDEPQQAVET